MLPDVKISQIPIAVAGNINLDVRISALFPSQRLFDDGETSVEEIYESLGGGATNVALAAARLGGTVHLCGCVGADELGIRIERAVADFGITPHVRHKEAATGRSINLNWTNHHRHFISSLPSNRQMTHEDIDVSQLKQLGCEQLYRGDIWFSEPMLSEGNRIVLRKARDLGMTTYLDINWDPEWSVPHQDARVAERIEQARGTLPYVSSAHGNESELTRFAGRSAVKDSCRFLQDHGCGEVIVHRGQRGAAALTVDGEWVEVPATPVKAVVSETGTGDVFSAAFMLLRELPLDERLMLCCRIAAQHLEGAVCLLPRL